MRPYRVSILNLLAGIALLGVGFAALRAASLLWANALVSVTLATLIFSALAIAYRRHRRRAFWVGFATFGWAYFLASFGPAPFAQIGPHLLTTALLDLLYPQVVPPPPPPALMPVPLPPLPPVGPAPAPSAMMPARSIPAVVLPASTKARVATERVILTGGFAGPPGTPISVWSSWTEPDLMPGRESVDGFLLMSPTTFRSIGHALFCLLIALVGGLLTRHLHATRDEPVPATT